MATPCPRSPARSRPDHLPVRNKEAVSQSTRPDLRTLYEKLLALRLDLVHGVMPRVERITLTAGDLEYLLAQLDAAIEVTRDIVGTESRSSSREPGTRQDTSTMNSPPRKMV